MQTDNSPIAQIKEKLRIEDIIGQTYTVIGKGHRRTTTEHDSLTLFLDTNTWYWYSRSIGGDLFDWWQYQHRCTFPTALEDLAAKNTATSKLLRARSKTAKTGSNVTISSITRVGTTATATSAAHGLATGDYIGVSGCTGTGSTQYNADPVQITLDVADPSNKFTYTMTSDPGASASGSPAFQKYLTLRLRQFMVRLEQGLALT